MMTTRCAVSIWASAASSFSASFTASCTNALMAGSPNAWSVPLPNPLGKPFTPATPSRLSKTAYSPSRTATFTSRRMRTISRCCPASKSWLPRTAAQGTRRTASTSASVFASSTRPRSVRSPHRTSPSASALTDFTSSRNFPCSSSRQCRSPSAARRNDRGIVVSFDRQPPLGRRAGLAAAHVVEPQVLEGVAVLHLREERAAADAARVVARRDALPRPAEQLAHDPVRHLRALAREGEPVQDDLGEQHLPVPVEAREEAIPVHLVAAGADEVRHVVAVEALPLAHERLRPDHLLGRREQHGAPHDLCRPRVLEPGIVHRAEAVAGREDEVAEPLAAVALPDPDRVQELGPEPRALEGPECRLEVAPAQEDVEVLRVPEDPRVLEERVGARDDVRDRSRVERPERVRPRVELAGRPLLGRSLLAHAFRCHPEEDLHPPRTREPPAPSPGTRASA